MDSRRGRPVISPIIRQVGFVTPTSPRETGRSDAQFDVESFSPTPEIIPPPAPRSTSPEISRASAPIAVPPPSYHSSQRIDQLEQKEPSLESASTSDFTEDHSRYEVELPETSASSVLKTVQGANTVQLGSTPRLLLVGAPVHSTTQEPAESSIANLAGETALPPITTSVDKLIDDSQAAYQSGSSNAVAAPPPGNSNRSPQKLPANGNPSGPSGGGATGSQAAVTAQALLGGTEMDKPGDGKCDTHPPPQGGTGAALKQKTTKAERRALQEAQRAAKSSSTESGKGVVGQKQPGGKPNPKKDAPGADKKAGGAGGSGGAGGGALGAGFGGQSAAGGKKKEEVPAPRLQFDDEQRVAKAKRRQVVEQTETKNRVELFRHLPQYTHGRQLPLLEAKFFSQEPNRPHPAVYQVGLQFLSGNIAGGNARTVAMLHALRAMVVEYSTPREKALGRDLAARISAQVSFLITCRPLSIGMGNAIRSLKQFIAGLPVGMPEAEAKNEIVAEIDAFIQDRIVVADQEIVRYAVQKIRTEGDVILTFGSSHVVESLLLAAHAQGRRFRVIVVDSRPKLEGRELLRRLLGAGIACTYAQLNAISYVMQEATKMFVGAAGVLANGTVYSCVGTAAVAMVAREQRTPVMICCETYKLHERVQLDSITSNELGDPDELVSVEGHEEISALQGWADNPHLQLLNLSYDVMPSEYVTMIITELGMVPPTSVPVILREYRRDPMLS